MAVTELAEPHAVVAGAEPATDPAVGGLAALLGSGDHRTIGRMYLVASMLLLVIGRVAGVLVDVERMDTSSVSVLDEYLGQVFSLHLVADTFLFLLPAFVGIALVVVPLQVGASTVSFPRAAAGSFWAWIMSSGVLLASYFIDGGPADLGTDRDGVLLWVVGLGGVIASLLVAVVCIATTVLALRTAGMTVDRVPMFAWASLVVGAVWLISLPVAIAVLVLEYLDVRYGAGIGAVAHLDWVFGVPQVFAFAFPLLGVLLDIVPVTAGERLRGRGTLLVAVALVGLLTFGADTLRPDVAGGVFRDALYVGGSFLVLLPLLVVLGAVADTLRRGKLQLSSPLLLGLLGYLLLLAAAVVNAVRVVDPWDLVGTAADSAVTELGVVGGILGVAAASHHWAPQLFGSTLKAGIGRLAALVLFVGGLAVGLPDLVSGFLDQPYGVASQPAVEDGVEALNLVTVVGGLLVLLGVGLVILNIVAGRDGDTEADTDPWNGHTLEWATVGAGPSEPVSSPTPLLDAKEATS